MGIRWVPLALLVVMSVGCNRTPGVVVVTGPASSPGWQVRYHAAVALVRRASDEANDPKVRETLLEMLDEEQQMRNFRLKDAKQRETTDVNGAQLTSITAMQALAEWKRKKPEVDLNPYRSAIEKLANSRHLALGAEAKKLLQTLK